MSHKSYQTNVRLMIKHNVVISSDLIGRNFCKIARLEMRQFTAKSRKYMMADLFFLDPFLTVYRSTFKKEIRNSRPFVACQKTKNIGTIVRERMLSREKSSRMLKLLLKKGLKEITEKESNLDVVIKKFRHERLETSCNEGYLQHLANHQFLKLAYLNCLMTTSTVGSSFVVCFMLNGYFEQRTDRRRLL